MSAAASVIPLSYQRPTPKRSPAYAKSSSSRVRSQQPTRGFDRALRYRAGGREERAPGAAQHRMKALLLVISGMILNIVVPLGVQVLDKRWLRPEQRERAWNGVSWAAALYAFGPLSMVGWLWVTRQEFWEWCSETPTRPWPGDIVASHILAILKTIALVGVGLLIGGILLAANLLLLGLFE
jgi:hypothetical protein